MISLYHKVTLSCLNGMQIADSPNKTLTDICRDFCLFAPVQFQVTSCFVLVNDGFFIIAGITETESLGVACQGLLIVFVPAMSWND